jgi:hypothetical protein
MAVQVVDGKQLDARVLVLALLGRRSSRKRQQRDERQRKRDNLLHSFSPSNKRGPTLQPAPWQRPPEIYA